MTCNTNNHNRNEKIEALPSITLIEFSKIIINVLLSDEFDARGVKYGFPLFERHEDRRLPGTDVAGIIPLMTNLFNQKFCPEIIVDREHRYPHSNYRCDIVFTHNSGKELWIELKQSWTKPCTPYETAFSEEEYINDIEKLNELPSGISKAILQLSYRSTSDYPEWPTNEIDRVLGNVPFVWNKFEMPTKDNGPCTCHILIWLLQ